MKLRAKFIVLAIALSLIPTAIGGLIIYEKSKAMLIKSFEERLRGIAKVQEARVNAYLDNLSDVMRIIVGKTSMKADLDLYNKTGDFKLRNHLIDNLNDTKSASRDILEISIFDEAGKVIISTDSGKIGTVHEYETCFTKGAKSCGFTGVFKIEKNAVTIHCSCPLVRDDRLIGIIGVIRDAGSLTSITSDYAGLGDSGETLLATRDAAGDALFIVPLRFDKKAALIRRVSKLYTKMAITRALSKEEGFWVSATDYRGAEVMAATRYIAKADWGLVVQIDKSEALSQLARIRKFIVYGVLALTMATMGIASFFIGKITGPLTALTKAAKKIGNCYSNGNGDRGASYGAIKSAAVPDAYENQCGDEIDVLESVFNEMTCTIARNRETLMKYLRELELSNSKLALLSEASFEGINVTQEGRLLDANKRYAEIFGYEYGEMLGMSIFDLATPQYRETVMKNISEGYDKPYEIDCLKKDGTVIRVEACGKSIEYEGRRLRLAAIRDITERMKREERLRQSEERFRIIAENISEVFWMGNIESGKTLYMSPAYERIWGRPLASIYESARFLIDTIHEDDRASVLTAFEYEKTGKPYDIEFRIIRPDGAVRWIWDRCFPVVDNSGLGTCYAGIAGDVTERKQMADALRESEERFRMIADTITEIFWMTDVEITKILYVSPAYERIWGRTLASLYENPRSFIDAIHKEDRQRVLTTLEVTKTGQSSDHEYRVIRPDGTIRWIWDRGFPVADKTGRVTRYIGVVSDVTERKQVEIALLESEYRFRKIFNAAPDAMFIAEKDTGIIIDANLSSENLMMMPREELIGMHHTRLHPPSVADFAKEGFQLHAAELRSDYPLSPGEIQVIRADGSLKWVEVMTQSIALNNKECLLGVFRDITIRKNHEATLRETADQLDKLNKRLEEKVKDEIEMRLQKEKLLIQQSKMAAMGEMIAAIAHQWKQPLNNLGLFIQDIRDAYKFGELDGAYIDTSVDKSMNEIQFMARTIEEFRNFFKPSVEKETCDLIEVASSVFSMLSAQLKINYITWSITCHSHNRTFRSIAEIMPCDASLIVTYKNQLAHVILNIINNARDAIIQRRRRGLLGIEDEGTISVDCYKEGNIMKLSISDNGGGIPEKIMDKIFEPYFTTKSEIEGTGIGLYMSKIIMEDKLGGSITVRNIEGGAVFTLEFTG